MKLAPHILVVSLGLGRAFAQADVSWTAIHWESAKVAGRTIEKAAMLVPVQLDGKSARILVQLDLGADLTQFDAVPYEQIFGKGTTPEDKPKKLLNPGVTSKTPATVV